MKWLILISLVSSIALGGNWEKEFTFSENDLIIEELNGYDFIRMPGFLYSSEPGSPLIPFFSVSVLIPPTAEITDVSVLDYEKIEIPGKYFLYPAQPPRPIGETIPFVPPDDSIYSLETEYPEERAEGIRSGCKSGYRIVGLFLYPISYIPKDSILFLYTRLRVRIEYEEGKYQPQYITPSQKELFSKDVERLVINPEDINQHAPPTHQVDNPEIDYVIITSSELTEHFEPLVNWLRKTGIWAETRSTDWIYQNYPGGGRIDQQWQIRNFITDYFNTRGLKYVLLAGDVSIVPSRCTWLEYGSYEEFVACDLYYADFQWSWDGNNNNLFGELGQSGVYDTVDLFYDLYIGRWSVETTAEVDTMIRKFMTYTKTPDTLYQKRILLPWGDLWQGYNAQQSQDSIANLSPEGWTDRYINLTCNPTEVRDSLNHGFGFCHLVGHGSEGGVYWTQSGPAMYTRANAEQQTNYTKLVVANSIACHPGDFDWSEDCLAEEMMKARGCAIAVIMNSGFGWGLSDIGIIGPSELFDVRFYDSLFSMDTVKIATTHQRSKENYRSNAIGGSWWYYWRWCYYELNLFGEPSMPLWTDNPRTMIADFPDFIYTEPQDFTVTVTSAGNPVDNAQVCLWKGNEIYDQKSTNASGIATFNINPLTSGYMYVTVTARNKLPVEDSCRVSPLLADRRLKVEMRHFQSGGVTINRVTVAEPYPCAWAVGDSGQVFKLSQTGWILPNYPITLNAEYNLTGVSFAPSGVVGYIVGYKRDIPDKWKGSIWKTTNGGTNWDSLPTPTFPGNMSVPFLDVSVVNEFHAWISCGHGEVLRTTDGGVSWIRRAKPGGSNHFGWLWGIWGDRLNSNYAWICSDQSGLIAMTTNGGDSWTNYEPAETDSLSYFDIDYYNNEAVAAAAKGRLLSCINGNWNTYFPFGSNQTSQWFYGAFNLEQKWGVGSSGIIGSYSDSARKYWCSKKYDLRDIEGFNFSSNPWENRYFMVGTNATILWGEESEISGDSGIEEPENIPEIDPEWTFNVADYGIPDQGWQVTGAWTNVDADSYRVYCSPKCDTNLYGTTGYGYPCWIKTVFPPCTSFYYDSALTGQRVNYTIVAYFSSGQPKSQWDTCTATDDVAPPQVTGLQGRYNDTLDVVEIWWDRITLGQEPNLAGYWVCPETIGGVDYNINHPCPLYRNYYVEKVPDWARGHYWGFWVSAMDRSGNRGEWSDSILVWIPNNQSNSPYATAFNQGRHLARVPKVNFNIVYENNGNVIHSYSKDNGKLWLREELDTGYFPSIGVDQENFQWITYWQEGDIVCIVKNDKGYSKRMVVFDGDNTSWAGPPAIALGTVPDISPSVNAFAYITYPVYIGSEMPEIPDQPPQTTEYSYIKLSILDTINIAHYTIDEGPVDSLVSNPAVAVTPADLLHLVWQKGGEIWYTANLGKITYDNWQSAQMQDKMNISDSPGIPSQHPCVESYGDKVYAAWREGKETEPGEIFRRMKDVSPPGILWGPIENISQSQNQESDYPVLATSDVVTWQEKVDSLNYEIYAWIKGDYVNLSETENYSQYPHIVVEPPSLVEPEVVIDAIWTEEITPNTLYEVKFKRYIHPTMPDGFGEYISVSVGDSVASPYCEQRDGYIDYGEFTCDYSASSLIYNIPYLHPKSNYLLWAVAYKEGGRSWQEEVYVDTTFVIEIIYEPSIPETVRILIPKETYENDFEIGKEIERILGSYAMLADLRIYEISLPDSGGGGAQGDRVDIKQFALYQNRPNPFKDLTKIAFAIPRECEVSLFIYDVSGRRVRTLIDGKLKPGNYNLKWDGKDNQNRNLGQGIYFYRLQTEDFKDTKKTVLLK